MPQNLSLCTPCATLAFTRRDFSTPFTDNQRVQMGNLGGLLSSLILSSASCDLCFLLLACLRKNEDLVGPGPALAAANPTAPDAADDDSDDGAAQWKAEWRLNSYDYGVARGAAAAPRFTCVGLYAYLAGSASSRSHCVQLVEDAGSRAPYRARELRPSVDVGLVREWLERSGGECGTRDGGAEGGTDGVLFVDLAGECLGEMSPGSSYVALSYVWGRVAQPVTTLANVASRRERGGLARVAVPRTIRDATSVAKALGYGYLWVDSLCIAQDDSVEKLRLVERMDALYKNAAVTIVAASGADCEVGLGGWNESGNGGERRGQVVRWITKDLRLGVIPDFNLEMASSVHASRAWTYQELHLSPRSLIFLGSAAYLSTPTALYREDFAAESDSVSFFQSGHMTAGMPQVVQSDPLLEYDFHVSSYSRRSLTYADDVQRAFFGIEKTLAAAGNGSRMWCGMLSGAFDWAVMFYEKGEGGLTRREGFPSWSWMGYVGAVTLGSVYESGRMQKWLDERTWIDWCVVEGGKVASIWDPIRDSSKHSNRDREGDDIDCPRYRPPTSTSKYGRTIPLRLPLNVPTSTTDSLDPIPTRVVDVRMPCLAFSTFSCTFTIDRAPANLLYGNFGFNEWTKYFVLRDRDSEICGIVQDMGLLDVEILSGRTAEVLLLSYSFADIASSLSHLNLIEQNKYKTRDEFEIERIRERLKNDYYNWSCLNIMLVCPHGDSTVLRQRVGTGYVFTSALSFSVSEVVWKRVFLA